MNEKNSNSLKASTRVNDLTGREILEIENSNDYENKVAIKKRIILNHSDNRTTSLQ